ncbi:MAG: DNA ligase D [Ferruginibacter sp.]
MAGVKKSKSLKSVAFPADIKPMLATLIDKPFDDAGWVYELKWDGYRAIAYLQNGKVEIRSRNNKSFNDKFYPILQALQKWKIDAVVDGEIVVVNDKGLPDFGDLQNWRSEADGHLTFYIFDILWMKGDLMNLPLTERRAILIKIIPDAHPVIKLSATFDASGSSFFALAEKMHLEGIMAKKADSIYIPDNRSKFWLKIKTEKRQEAIICGYTINENTSKPFSALLLGLYENKKLISLGPVGTGFSVQQQKDLIKKLKPFETADCPFATIPDFNKPSRFRPNPPKAEVVWVKPKLVCEISYRELTKDKALRHPSYKGLREDKLPADIGWEKPVVIDTKNTTLADKNMIKAPVTKDRKTFLNPTDESQVRKIGGHDLKFQNLSKVYWPKENITKRDMLNYYYQVAPFILPYLKDRPQTLNRYPNGITGDAFYQKDVKGKVPEWLDTFPYYSEADEREKEFIICNNEASLLYIASLGCIEINPWSSRKKTPDNPDWCIIDLDPDKNTFNQVIEAANLTHDILNSIDAVSFCKTSGSTGLHIYIPLGGKYTYEESKEFGRKIATILHGQIPGYTSIERQTKNRNGKMYIDFLQNRPQATVASVYSLRPKPGAPVSMPLHWEEVKKGLKITDFTIFNSIERIKEQGDIFKGVLGKGINLKQVLKKVESLF